MTTPKDHRGSGDPLAEASRAVALVIALNKPIYPIYVWFISPGAFAASLWTMVSFPLFAAIVIAARRFPSAARVAVIAVGTVDTVWITKVIGEASGSWLFLPACIMLTATSFYQNEVWRRRISASLVFIVAAGLFGRYGHSLANVPIAAQEALYTLNAIGAFSLMAFVALRFPRPPFKP